ncbi:hypothetical protein BH688_15505 [Kushneria phosphatilytica]|uniref:Phospholipid carrier-dependent glycosyltransferase n=2 Tax=Kushneria phosphatilytica TaxID=657387 RepID=A0A1S1NRZ4_9GAMM|nr:hypothetical protein BH688_15505 [Kushneria phosphatilytica]QEL12685.1 phospholipid carrier-dependent glycosyltransferase [Kushneria phosphatilytica]
MQQLWAWCQRHPVLALLLPGLLLCGLGIGLRSPWPADEPRFALIAQEMLTTHQWLIPHRAGELYPDKPPIFMWAIAAGLWLTDNLRVAFLLPSLLGALATLAMTTDLARRLYSPKIALLTGLTLLVTVQFTLQARTAQIDMLVTAFITLGLYGALRHALTGPRPGWWYVACIAMGLGILTKGVGFLPLLLLPAWWWLGRRPGGGLTVIPLRWHQLLIGLLLLLATLAAWGVPMILYTSYSSDPTLAAYRDNILFKQTGQRYADSWHHLEPFWYYVIEVLPWAWLPPILALPWSLRGWKQRLGARDPRLWLPLSYVVLMVAFFSLSPGKRGVYMTPGIAMFVLSLAPLLPQLLEQRLLNRLAWGLGVLLGSLVALAGLLGALGLPALTRLAATQGFTPWSWWLTIGALTAVIAFWLPPRRGLVSLAVWLMMFWVLWSTWGYDVMDAARSERALMSTVYHHTGDAPLALIDFDEAQVLQARQPIVQFGDATPSDAQFVRMTAWLQTAPQQRWGLLTAGELEAHPCVSSDQVIQLTVPDRHDWRLLPGTAVADCPGDRDAAPLFQAPTTTPLGEGER